MVGEEKKKKREEKKKELARKDENFYQNCDHMICIHKK